MPCNHEFERNYYTKSKYYSSIFYYLGFMMTEDTASSTIPFPTLTIIYLVAEAHSIVEEIGHKYNNITVEDCFGFFHGGVKQQYKKITIWSQGIDTLWFNAVIARIKEIGNVETVPIVSGGIMYSV
jgi:hypothetical protein